MSGQTPDGRRYSFDAGAAARSLEGQGGFSMQRSTGRSPSRGYMVSDFGSEHIIPGLASPRDIEEYRQGHPNRTSARRYVGGWHDEGKTYLDQSRRVMTSRSAQELGQQNAQRAVYNVHRGAVRRVHFGGPVDVRGTLFEGHKEPSDQLRTGNSDALRQQKEMELRLQSAGAQAGRSVAHRPAQARQLRLPGMTRF